MPKIYEIVQSLKELNELVDNADLTPEQEDEILAVWSASELALEEKAQGIVSLVKQIDADTTEITNEINRLTKMKKTLTNTKKKVKVLLLEAMLVSGKKEIKTALHKIQIRNNPESVILDDDFSPSELPYAFQTLKIEANKTAIKEAYRSTGVLPNGVKIKRTRSLTIK